MSILFEAWRRARGRDSRLSETLGAPPEVGPARRAILPWLLCFLLAAVAAGLGVYLWRTHASPAATAVARSGTAGANSDVVTAASEVAAKPVSRPVGGSHVPSAQAVAAVPSLATAAPRQPLLAQPAPAVADPGANTALEPSAVVAAAPAASAPGVVPQEGFAPDDVRAALPAFTVSVHVWNEDPTARFIMVGGHVYRPGDEIASGVRLLEVTRTGEVVGFRGYRIELPAG